MLMRSTISLARLLSQRVNRKRGLSILAVLSSCLCFFFSLEEQKKQEYSQIGKMNHVRRILMPFIICYILCTSLVGGGSGEDRSLRRKRYVVFPEGSSFSIALCMTVHTLTSDDIFTEGLNWGISYDLPNESKPALEPFLELRTNPVVLNKYEKKIDNANYIKHPVGWNYDRNYYYPQIYPSYGGKKYYRPDYNYIRRRHRRELYNKLEIIMNAMGFEGRTCVLRALCEASQRLMPKGNTLVEEMIRIAFTLPLKKVLSYEPQEHHTYTDAHRAGHEGRNCATMFPGCSFSLIDMALGKYSSDGSTAGGSDQEYNVPPYQTNYPILQEEDTVTGSYDATSRSVRYNMK